MSCCRRASRASATRCVAPCCIVANHRRIRQQSLDAESRPLARRRTGATAAGARMGRTWRRTERALPCCLRVCNAPGNGHSAPLLFMRTRQSSSLARAPATARSTAPASSPPDARKPGRETGSTPTLHPPHVTLQACVDAARTPRCSGSRCARALCAVSCKARAHAARATTEPALLHRTRSSFAATAAAAAAPKACAHEPYARLHRHLQRRHRGLDAQARAGGGERPRERAGARREARALALFVASKR